MQNGLLLFKISLPASRTLPRIQAPHTTAVDQCHSLIAIKHRRAPKRFKVSGIVVPAIDEDDDVTVLRLAGGPVSFRSPESDSRPELDEGFSDDAAVELGCPTR